MSIDTTQHGTYDDGLAHGHDWARDGAGISTSHPVVADATSVGTPSSVFHDDLHYAAD